MMFCKHNFEYDEKMKSRYIDNKLVEQGTMVSVCCKKCGYHFSYSKFK